MSFSTRLLIFVVIFIAIGGASLWILGGKKTDYSTSVTINATPQQIFPYLTQPELLTEWVNGLEQVEPLIPNEDENLPSSASTTTRVIELDGKRLRFEDEVMRFEQDKLLSIRSSNHLTMVTAIFELAAVDRFSTELNYRVRSTNLGIGRFLAPFQKTDQQSRIADEALRLKKLVEQSENNPAAGETVDKAFGKHTESLYEPPMFDQSSGSPKAKKPFN
jgi:uncharacterized protein YndB with AHSA1/START domain